MVYEQNDNATLALQAFLRELKAPVTTATAGQTFGRHPHYPSLLAVTDCLHEWRIDHTTTRVQPDQLSSIPTPFFTQVNLEGGLFTVVGSVSETGVHWLHTKKGWQQDTLTDFRAKWVPIVLLAEVSEASGEVDFQRNRRQERISTGRTYLVWAALFVGLLLTVKLLSGTFAGAMSWQWSGFFLTKLSGIGLSVYLLAHSTKRTGWSSSLCQFHQKVDCDAVLTSTAATLWGWLSWSEIGFVYFSGSALALLMEPEGSLVKTALWGLGLAALPYPLFSVYYQARVVKKWCTVCLAVQALVLLDGLLLLDTVPTPVWNLAEGAGLILAFLLPITGWVLAKPLLERASQQPALQNELTRLRANTLVFSALLSTQKPVPPLPHELQPICMGNPEATYSLTLVVNPYCGPCADTFADMEHLLDRHPFINCKLLFATTAHENDPRAQFIRRLYTIPAEERITALKDWYVQQKKDFSTWSNAFHTTEGEPYAHYQMHLHSQWCAASGIESTPAILINGHPLPPSYPLRNIPFLLKYGPARQSVAKRPDVIQPENEYQS